MYQFTIRKNLGSGKNYLKTKVYDKRKCTSQYLDIGQALLLENCKLVNQKATAKKIYSGSNKAVCAWVAASKVTPVSVTKGYGKLFYNPRVAPNWQDAEGNNIDGMLFNQLYLIGGSIYVRG